MVSYNWASNDFFLVKILFNLKRCVPRTGVGNAAINKNE